jgi:hypothetical protein
LHEAVGLCKICRFRGRQRPGVNAQIFEHQRREPLTGVPLPDFEGHGRADRIAQFVGLHLHLLQGAIDVDFDSRGLV